MNIGIDGNLLNIAYHSGLRHYTENLLANLAKLDKINSYYIFSNSKVVIPNQKNFTLVVVPSKLPILKRQIFIPVTMKKYNLDVVHYPCDTWLPVFFGFPNSIVTLADFGSYNAYPKWHENFTSFLIGKYYNFMRRSLIDTCAHIMPISDVIKKEAIKNNISTKKMTTVHLGVGSIYKQRKVTNKKSFLAFADFSPRKNIVATIKAHLLFVKRTGIKIPLVIVTSDNRPHKFIHETAKTSSMAGLVRIQTNVSAKKLISLYNKSIALIYPSLYEGFGLPILEAMACGCPVITSDYGAMKEVSGNAAVLVNPDDAEQICDSMIQIIESKSYSKKLIKLGLARSKRFTWEKTAGKTLKIYEKIYNYKQ